MNYINENDLKQALEKNSIFVGVVSVLGILLGLIGELRHFWGFAQK